MNDYRRIEFGQFPLVIGPLVGRRAFRMSEDELTGVYKHTPWLPGENVAECLATKGDRYQGTYAAIAHDPWSSSPADPHAEPAPFMGCTCGFYAYFDGSNTYYNTARVEGLIEGYGHMIVGSRGFRAEKAQIVALIQPAERFMSEGEEFQWRSICATYPHAAVFTEIDEAIAQFPLTPVDLKAVEKQAS